MIAAHLGHFHGERQRVIGVFEQTVIVDDDRMEMIRARPPAYGTAARS